MVESRGMRQDPLTERIIGGAIEVHRLLGPGLLESAYEECLCWELRAAGLSYGRQVPLPLTYKGIRLDAGYRLDVVVENVVLVEIKIVERLAPIHQAQLLAYMRLAGLPTGLLIKCNDAVLKNGIKRMVL